MRVKVGDKVEFIEDNPYFMLGDWVEKGSRGTIMSSRTIKEDCNTMLDVKFEGCSTGGIYFKRLRLLPKKPEYRVYRRCK